MKVRCINKTGWIWIRRVKSFWRKNTAKANGPKLDDIVTIRGEYWDEGQRYYLLVEWPCKDNSGWIASQFEPIVEQFQSVTFEKIKEKASVN